SEQVLDVAEPPAPQSAEPGDETQVPLEPAPTPVPAGKPLPRPMYLETPEVTPASPEPLAPPQEPTPSRQVQLSEGVSSQYQEKIAEKANNRLDLDKGLKRRRGMQVE